MRDQRGSAHTARRVCVFAFAVAFIVSVFPSFAAQAAYAQHNKLAPPGDSAADAGPLAHLSPKFKRRDVVKAMKLVADWQLGRLPAQPQYDWTWAALYTGFMAVPNQVAGDKYKNAVMKIGEQLNWEPGPRVMTADDQAIGQSYLELYRIHKDSSMIGPMRARLAQEMDTPESDWNKTPQSWWAKGHYAQIPLWWWCDALYMAPPVYADMAAATGDGHYLAFMDRQWTATTDLLYDRNVHLYSRDATYLDQHEKNGQKIFWSRGNGWVMGGIVRVLQTLPKDSPLRPKFEEELRQMSAEMLSIQSKDGLWRPGLLDADSYPLPEISGSAFITYAMAWGVNEGILDKATYWPAVQKAWEGMLSHVYADGRLGCIQPVGAAPGAYTETSSYVYGVGAYLLAGSEIYRGVK
ncbi:MAG TPA: glycoside hydrolase family 88 protein [Terracidiphilus sp.]|nr:glycoside hydrolase family 88 protein [Terracidiphilus sp.]